MKVFGKVAGAVAFGMTLVAVPASAQSFKDGVDTNGDGGLDMAEFVSALTAVDLVRYDVNGDGSVTVKEFGDSNARPAKRTKNLVRRYDDNKDGILQESEFMKMNEMFFDQRDKDGNGSISAMEVNPELKMR